MERLMVALDVPSAPLAMELFGSLHPAVRGMKVGLELVHSAGLDILRRLVDADAEVFYDAKLHDIPNTVAGAMRQIAGLGIALVNVHALGGRDMMRAALEAAQDGALRASRAVPKVIAVTMLTSMDEGAMHAVGLSETPLDSVRRLAALAKESGLDGVVCAGEEVQAVREACGDDFLTVVPGIRRPQDISADQRRVLDPETALRRGASVLVVGRSITRSPQPRRAALEFLDTIARVEGSA